MSILSSTQSGKYILLTPELLIKRGYKCNKVSPNIFYRNNGDNHYIQQKLFEDKTFVVFIDSNPNTLNPLPYTSIELKNLLSLEDIEKYWDEEDKDKREALGKQIINKYKNL